VVPAGVSSRVWGRALVGTAMVNSNFHWLSDVLAGWALAAGLLVTTVGRAQHSFGVRSTRPATFLPHGVWLSRLLGKTTSGLGQPLRLLSEEALMLLGGLGWGEFVVVLLIALVVVGPERLPGVAEQAGTNLRKLRVWLKAMTDEVQAELGPEVGDLDLRSLHPREFLRKNLFEDPDEDTRCGGRRGTVLLVGEPAPWDPDTT
jgi:sec-independent protein translocase protein TatB